MLYLDYAKPVAGGYILNFFADSEQDIEQVSGGKSFVSKNGTNYGVPLSSSTVIITQPDKTKKTYVLSEDGNWYAGGAAAGSKVEANVQTTDEDPYLTSVKVDDNVYKNHSIVINPSHTQASSSLPYLNQIECDGEIYKNYSITANVNIGTDAKRGYLSTIECNGTKYDVTEAYPNMDYKKAYPYANYKESEAIDLKYLYINGRYYRVGTNDGVSSIGGLTGAVTLGPQLSVSDQEISVNIEANAETTQDTPELTSLKIADNVYKVPTADNVLVLQGELFKYDTNDDNYNIKVIVSSYQEGKAIADRFKKGDIIRVSYNTGSVVRTGDIIYCEDYTWCGNNLQWINLYAMSYLSPDRNLPGSAPSVVRVSLQTA